MKAQGFFDESGDHPQEKAYIMAGWVADATEWQAFCMAWKAVLEAPPRIAYFKHHDAITLENQFRGWSPAERDRKMLELTKVICGHRLAYGVVTTFQHHLYASLVRGWLPPRRLLKSLPLVRSPYPMCFLTTVATVLQQQVQRGITDQVDFTFDSRSDALDKCISHYRRTKTRIQTEAIRSIAGNIVPADDKIVLPLQAADLLAGQFLTTLRANRNGPFLNELARHHTIFENEVNSSELAFISNTLQASGLISPMVGTNT